MYISGNFWLNQNQMEINAQYIWQQLQTQGWTVNSVAAMLGNMQSESTINPGIWQGLDPDHAQPWGYGLVQWTPSTKYTDWCKEQGIAIDSMDSALARINWEVENNAQWIPTAEYPLSFADFKASNDTPYNLARAFLANYERPSDPNQPWRGTQAQEWYLFLVQQPFPADTQRPLPLYYYMRKF